jgi:hypothetical protein
VDSLHLDIEERIRVDFDGHDFGDELGKFFLVCALDLLK